ncbi:hypothetical protein E0L36_07445 [Streptomyces sp. AJS327]|uniref:AMP-binding protein n=1 Tax=Streptomyces sp. AJS327 TaxID=2545265 RepID=UPI0015DF6D69|nr:AMP-binding protein [Streptomyces sp. AJS327]MBA0050735.1 hypothetical protein [Streptomyces sp. AJS327]
MSNLATVLVEAAERYPLRPAVRAGGTVLTYAELDELSGRVAGGLLAHGVRAGDLVGLRLPGGPVFPVVCFGILRVGAIVLPARPPRQPSSPTAERPPTAVGGAARLVFASPQVGRDGPGPSDGPLVVPVGPDFLDQVALWPRHSPVADRADDDPAVLLGTAEAPDTAAATVVEMSTGRPAPAPGHSALTHGRLCGDPELTARALGTTRFEPGPPHGVSLWRQVLAALNDDSPDDGERAATLAFGAAHLAARRKPEGRPPTPDDVMAVAFEEFSLLIDADQARAALRSLTPPNR